MTRRPNPYSGRAVIVATDAQIRYIQALTGLPCEEGLTKQDASMILDRLKGFDEVRAVAVGQHGYCAYCTQVRKLHPNESAYEAFGDEMTCDFRMHLTCALDHVADLWDESESKDNTPAMRKDRAARAQKFGQLLDETMSFVMNATPPLPKGILK